MDKKALLNVALWGLNRLAEPIMYTGWPNDFARKEASKSFELFLEELEKLIDWNNLTEEDCITLRFKRLSENSDLMLIPLYLFNIVPEGLEVECINGEKLRFHKGLDNDIRFGCTAYGIHPKKN